MRAAVVVVFAASCATQRAPPSQGAPAHPRSAQWERTVALSPDARTLTVTTCTEPGVCDERRVAITSAAQRSDDALVIDNSTWLRAPMPFIAGLTVRTRFDLPTGDEVSVPWPREGGVYTMDATAFLWKGYTVLGPFARDEVAFHGTVFDIARLGRTRALRWSIEAWLGRALQSAQDLVPEARFDRLQVILVPSRGRRGEGVSFGMVSRGGGRSVLLVVDPDAPEEALGRDWQTTHEFVHLVHPVFFDEDAWLREGIATYYQEVLRARSGAQTPAAAWTALVLGMSRGTGAGASRTLAEESAAMRRLHHFDRVYWGGAALVMLADVALRREPARHASMDTALRALYDAASREPERAWSAREAIRVFDRVAGGPVWAAVAEPSLASTEPPPVDAVFHELGLRREADGSVSFDDGAPLAAMRTAIMRDR